jgi:carboxyl-terminal processing protease
MKPASLRCLLLSTAIAASLSFTSVLYADDEFDVGISADGETDGVLPLEDLRTFAKVFNQIRQGYVKDVSDAKLLEYAIKGMLSELDPHSAYLDATSFENLQTSTSGEFGGLGIEVGMENGFVKVISPIDDTPASRAGVEVGDFIIKLDDKPVKGMALNEALDSMRGEKGTEIRLTISREGVDQPIELTLVRDIIKVASVRSRFLEEGYGYLRISQFQINTGTEVVEQVQKLREEQELRGLIVDLRNNPGGVLQASVDVVDTFLEEGLIVYTEGRLRNEALRYSARPGDELEGLPLVVLINAGSASASEIVAGALQDHHRAVIVGTDSFGKGSVQTVLPINDTSAIKLTTALYFTPKGRSIQAQGIIPDVVIERAQYTALKGPVFTTEADLSNHLGNGNGGDDSGSLERENNYVSQAELVSRDNQLYEALNLLKGIHVFGMGKTPKTSIASREATQTERLVTPAADQAQ